MRFLLTIVPLTAAMIIAACSPAEPDTSTAAPVAAATSASPISGPTATAPPVVKPSSAPANLALGSPEWFDWVDKTLAISDDGHGPKPQTPGWDEAVNRKLGQEAPQAAAGSTEWQQAVDALLRTRVVVH